MDAIKYLKKRDIMCDTYDCDDTCPLGEVAAKHLLTCREFENLYPEQAIDIVRKYGMNDNEEKFRAMWSYLSAHPGVDKFNAIKHLGDEPFKIKNACYACQEANGICSLCPLPERVCSGKDSLYSHWLHARDSQVLSELAKIISASEWKVRGNND